MYPDDLTFDITFLKKIINNKMEEDQCIVALIQGTLLYVPMPILVTAELLSCPHIQ
jgi:hypothetical protein